MNASFYILWSDLACKFNIGHTTEPIAEGVRKHNANHKGFTGKFQDWKLVYQEAFPSKSLAYGENVKCMEK
jgi:putative endonuclease